MTGSNRRPPACKAGALPAELIPQLKQNPKTPKPQNPYLTIVLLIKMQKIFKCADAIDEEHQESETEDSPT